MEVNTSNEERGPVEGNVPIESGASNWGQTGVGQEEIPSVGGSTPTLNPTAATFTPRPASARPATPPSLERLARELKELKSSELSIKQRLEVLHDQRRQLLSHMATAKSEIDQLDVQLGREGLIEGPRDVLNRRQELNELHKWAGHNWRDLGDEVSDLQAEIAMPGSRSDAFWGL